MFGVDVHIRRDRELYLARTFSTRASALDWAEAERRALEAD